MAALLKNLFIPISTIHNILNVDIKVINRWLKNGVLTLEQHEKSTQGFYITQLQKIEVIKSIIYYNLGIEEEYNSLRQYYAIELFAGAGGLALGMMAAGFEYILLTDKDKTVCETLNNNFKYSGILIEQEDIRKLSFTNYKHNVDLLCAGLNYQTFSTNNSLFFEFVRATDEIQPRIFLIENVKSFIPKDNGKSLNILKKIILSIGYTLLEPKVLNALHYKVPQKKECLFLIGIRNDLLKLVTKEQFIWPKPYNKIYTVKDALYRGPLYKKDVPPSPGQEYSQRKKAIMHLVPMGGNWKNLPLDIQKEYMQNCLYTKGGKTGFARRLHLDQPSLTLTTSPAMKQTERCHPLEDRPLNIREYARMQTFPDDFTFAGGIKSQYKQIGNAVPINLAHALGLAIINFLNLIEEQANKRHN